MGYMRSHSDIARSLEACWSLKELALEDGDVLDYEYYCKMEADLIAEEAALDLYEYSQAGSDWDYGSSDE